MAATLAPGPATVHTSPGRAPTPWPLVLTTAIAPLAWGTTYLVTTEALPPGRPLLAGVLRALPAGLALAALTRRRPVGRWWAKAAVLGILNIGGFFALLSTHCPEPPSTRTTRIPPHRRFPVVSPAPPSKRTADAP